MPYAKEASDPPQGELQAKKKLLCKKLRMLKSSSANSQVGKPQSSTGREWLQAIIETGQSQKLRALTLDVDPATDDIECLIAACQVVKGKCDYQR